jgi:hypothetical protein
MPFYVYQDPVKSNICYMNQGENIKVNLIFEFYL